MVKDYIANVQWREPTKKEGITWRDQELLQTMKEEELTEEELEAMVKEEDDTEYTDNIEGTFCEERESRPRKK